MPDTSFGGLLVDLSQAGLGVVLNTPLRPQKLVCVELPGAPPLLARVAREPDGSWLHGCDLLDPLTPEAVDKASRLAGERHIPIAEAAAELGLVTPRQVAIARAGVCECPYVDLSAYQIDLRNSSLIPTSGALSTSPSRWGCCSSRSCTSSPTPTSRTRWWRRSGSRWCPAPMCSSPM